MTSWWRKIAEDVGIVPGGSGSWKRRVAEALGTTAGDGSWPRRIATGEGYTAGSGSWDRRIAEGSDAAAGTGSWARRIALNEGGGVPAGPTAPAAFTAGQWSVADPVTNGDLTVTVSALPSNGGSAITAIQYRVDGGTWTASGISSTGTFGISGLTDDVEVDIELRAVNAVGNGPASDVKAATPTGVIPEIEWTPAMIGAKHWHSVTDPTTMLDTGAAPADIAEAVETWNDLSGNARHLVSAANAAGVSTAATRGVRGASETLGGHSVTPLRMGNAVLTHRYIGPAGGFAMPSGSLGDILFTFSRIRPPATAVQRVLVGNSAGSFNTNIGISSTTAQGQVYTGSVAGTPKTDTTTRLEILVQEKRAAAGNVYNLRLNGTETLTADGAGGSVASGTQRAVLGNVYNGSTGADCDIFEFLVLPQGTTRANVQRLEGWCAHYYGQTALLPADHPYKTVAPLVPVGTTSTAAWVDGNFAPAVALQTWRGPQAELQVDSYNGLVASDPPIDGSTDIWGFPYSLDAGEQTRLKNEYFPGGGLGYMFLRHPMGFAYRGVRATDGTSGLGTKIGERFAGQNASITALLANVVSDGGGLWPEYWSPAPHWKTNSAYGGGAGQPGANPAVATLWAGGANARTVTLDSIRVSDPTGYATQIGLLTDAMLDDLEYLHANVAPVRGFGLANEYINGSNDSYGHCVYTDQLYVDVLTSIVAKIAGSAALATYGGNANDIFIHAASWQQVTATIKAAGVWSSVDANSVHYITSLYADADYAKTNATSWLTNSGGKQLIDNEFEYFVTPGNAGWQFANTALVQAHFMRLLKAETHNPMIHIAKPIGQVSASSNTEGYAVVAARLPAPFSQDPSTPDDPYPGVDHGEWISQGKNANAVKLFANNVPVGAKVMPSEYVPAAGRQIVPFVTAAGKRGYVVINRSAPTTFSGTDLTITLGFSKQANITGKLYSETDDGTAIATETGVSARAITVTPDTAQVWVEQ